MKVLILGGAGMLGHELARLAAANYEIVTTVRDGNFTIDGLSPSQIRTNVDASRPDTVRDTVQEFRPQVVVNCIGIVKQLKEAKSPLLSIQINALFPHQLEEMCASTGARLIHVSTDCVFSGKTGGYRESDSPDPVDLYGHTKLLGEVSGTGSLTLRTSMIGRQLRGHTSLLDWFLTTKDKQIQGFRHAIFSGLTTTALSRVILKLIAGAPKLNGLYHVSSDPIDKFTLLNKIREHYRREIEIVPNTLFYCDRSLDSSTFKAATGIKIPSWDEMIAELPVAPVAQGAAR